MKPNRNSQQMVTRKDDSITTNKILTKGERTLSNYTYRTMDHIFAIPFILFIPMKLKGVSCVSCVRCIKQDVDNRGDTGNRS